MADDPVNGVKAGIDAARGATTSVDGVPASILNTARNIALQSGDPNAVSNFMIQQGYPQHAGEWCGDFVSAVIHASGGTPPPASPVAGAWANYGSPRQGGPQPGDIAIQRGQDPRTGLPYTHVTFVDSVNPNGTFVGLGGNQGGGQLNRSTFNTSGFDFRNPAVGPGTPGTSITSTKGLDLPDSAPNAGQYQPLINASAAKYGINPTWLGRLLYQENLFKPTGTSSAGAQGIAQFMPATAARYGVNVNDPASSIDGAAHYLSDNLTRYGGNTGLATAAYNWGEQNVDQWLQGNKTAPKETLGYVQGITGHSLSDWKAQPAGAPAAPGPIDPSIIAHGGVSPPIPASSSPATPVPAAGALAAGGGSVLPGFPDASTSNQFTQNLSNFDKALGGQDLGGNQTGAGQDPPRAQPLMMGPGIRNMGNPAMAARQVWGQTLNSIRAPGGQGAGDVPALAQWGSASPGQAPYANIGQQGEQQAAPYGTSISSQQMAYGLSPYQLQMLMNPMMLNQMGGGYG